LAAVVMLMAIVGTGLWFYLWQKPGDSGVRLEEYAARYSPAVAFVLVEYGLRHKEKIYFQQHAQGTAFLVDDQGHLLTSRHVACPWLESPSIYRAFNVLKQQGMPADFYYKLYVWFEGEKAFNLAVSPSEDIEVADLFYLENAYASDGDPRVEIIGVPLAPTKRLQAVAAPLRNDFAVLKLTPPPPRLTPLPLDPALDPLTVPRLTRVIALGFPLGRRTQESTVNVSATWGHVRRTFKNLLQIDAAVYEGNSGGPVIGIGGKVIGIATGVASKQTPGTPFMPTQVTPLWNIAMVLPINKAVAFLEQIKAGQTKWNGLLDLEVESKLKRILDLAQQERWSQARALSKSFLEKSRSPRLIMAGGIIDLCTGDLASARELLSQSLSINRQDNPALFLLFLADWLDGKVKESHWGPELYKLDWRSSMHFFGYLAQVLTGKIDPKAAHDGWDNPNEKGWLYYLLGLLKNKQGALKDSEALLKQAVLSADPDDWVFYLALSTLGRQIQKSEQAIEGQEAWNDHLAKQQAWRQMIRAHIEDHQKRQKTLAELYSRLARSSTAMPERLAILKKINELVPEDRDIIAGLAYMAAMREDWQQTKDYIAQYMKRPGRQSIVRLGLGLLDAELSHVMGKHDQALAELDKYLKVTTEPWFRSLAECLSGKLSPQELQDKIGSNPQNLLTFNLAMGLWAEGNGEPDKARKYYRSAMESLLDEQLEYELVKSRLRKLRKTG
ncbi:MAG: trypsin-like peptidase domain-containing protein, partial [Desulfarculaceae bacterium]